MWQRLLIGLLRRIPTSQLADMSASESSDMSEQSIRVVTQSTRDTLTCSPSGS